MTEAALNLQNYVLYKTCGEVTDVFTQHNSDSKEFRSQQK